MLTQVRLKNFKCFEDLMLELGAFTLLAGLNGMGKSSVIQSLLLLRQNYDIGLLKKNKSILLNGELVQLGNAKDLLFQYFSDPRVEIRITTKDHGTGRWQFGANVDSDNLPLLSTPQLKDPIYKASMFTREFHYLTAERLGPRTYFEISNYKVINQNQLGIRGEFAANYFYEYQRENIPIDKLKHPTATGLTLYEQVNAWLSEIRPGTRVDVTSIAELGLMGMSYQFIGGKDVSNKFRPTNVGFGLSYLFPLLVAVLASKPGALIIVENPEAHLHPQGQSRIGWLLATAAANGLQIIVETHSEHILNGARIAVKESFLSPSDCKLAFFSGEVKEDQFRHFVLNPVIDESGRLDFWPEGFLDQADKDIDKLFGI